MKNRITDEIIENVGILAQLELSKAELTRAKEDMESMLEFVDVLNEIDTKNVVGLTGNECALREDEVTNSDCSAMLLKNAPDVRDGMYVVPKTI